MRLVDRPLRAGPRKLPFNVIVRLNRMLPQLRQHVLSELDRSVQADTVIVFGAVVLDVVSTVVNSALANTQGVAAQLIF